MRLQDFVEEDLCDVCGTGQPKRVVDGLLVCGKCYRTKDSYPSRVPNDPDEDQPIRRNKHERFKTGR
jgi:ribosomal protein L37AE/L43A